MKSLIILLAFYSLSLIAICQSKLEYDESTSRLKIEKVVEVENTSKDQLFSYVKNWFGETFTSAKDVITMENKEGGLIVGRYVDKYKIQLAKFDFYNQVKVYMKENKYKVVITNIENFDAGTDLEVYLVKKDGTFRNQYQNLRNDIEIK